MKKSKKTKTPVKKKAFSFIGEIYIDVPGYTIFTYVNKTKKELEKFLNNKKYKHIKKEILNNYGCDKYSGQFTHYNTNLGVLEMKQYKFDWPSFDVLNHEISHMVDFLSKDYCFEGETEFKAYLHECTNRKIRRILFDNK